MSRADRDRLVAGRENRGFSYTEESDEGEEGRKEGRNRSPLITYALSGEENISPVASVSRATCRVF